MGDSKKTIRFSKKTIRFRNDNDGNVYSRSGVSSDPVNRRAAVQIVHDRRFVSTPPPPSPLPPHNLAVERRRVFFFLYFPS